MRQECRRQTVLGGAVQPVKIALIIYNKWLSVAMRAE